MYHVSGFSSSGPPASYCCIFVDCSAKWKGGAVGWGWGGATQSQFGIKLWFYPLISSILITSDPQIFKSRDLFSFSSSSSSSSFFFSSHLLPSENSTWCFPSGRSSGWPWLREQTLGGKWDVNIAVKKSCSVVLNGEFWDSVRRSRSLHILQTDPRAVQFLGQEARMVYSFHKAVQPFRSACFTPNFVY